MGRDSDNVEQTNDVKGATERRSGNLDRRGAQRLRASADHKRRATNVLTASEAASFLKVSRQALYEAAGRDEIPHRRIGKRFVFSRDALLSWLECGYA